MKQETQKSNSPKVVCVLNKKPRASKTSKRHTIGGLNFFFKFSKGTSGNGTGGNLLVYYDEKPFPYIKMFPSWYHYSTGHATVEELTEIATQWCIENQSEIIKRLKMLDTYIKIDEEMWRANERK